MAKTPKTYRLSPITCLELDTLKALIPGATETEIVETAITYYLCYQDPKYTQLYIRRDGPRAGD